MTFGAPEVTSSLSFGGGSAFTFSCLTLGFRDGHFPSGGPGLLMQTRALPPENDLLEEAPDRELGSTTENTLSFPQAADA